MVAGIALGSSNHHHHHKTVKVALDAMWDGMLTKMQGTLQKRIKLGGHSCSGPFICVDL